MIRRLASALAMFTSLSPLALAQQSESDRIDMYFGDWHTSAPHMTHGSLEERDILTRGDPHHPTTKGAVLQFINSYSYATLAPGASTQPARLEGRQEIYFFVSGRGSATAGGVTADLFQNIAILMPANLEFTLKNTGDGPLAMYIIDEPTPPGFRPNEAMLVRDENTLPIASSNALWCHIDKMLFVTADGLGTLQSVLTLTLDSLTIAQPHVVDHDDIEEIWAALDGTSIAFISNQLRKQPPGVAYLHIPDNKTPHSNINYMENEQVKFLYFARYHPHETRK